MRTILASAAALILLTGAAPGLAKQGKNQPILVDAAISPAQWAEDVSSRLDRNLRVMQSINSAERGDAIIQIRFDVVDGAATNLRMMHSSGVPYVDGLARLAVKRLTALPQIQDQPRQEVLANILVASDPQGMDRLEQKLARSESLRLASADPADRALIALSARASPRS